jgi:hypothetical protein
MSSRSRLLVLGALLSLVVVSTISAADNILICSDFTLFPDDHKFPDTFTYSAFKFKKLGGTLPLFVNESGGGKGLQFPKDGVEIVLPTPVEAVDLNVGTFAGKVEIESLDSGGKTIESKSLPQMNKFAPITITASGKKIATVRLRLGGNEGSLEKICIKVKIAE